MAASPGSDVYLMEGLPLGFPAQPPWMTAEQYSDMVAIAKSQPQLMLATTLGVSVVASALDALDDRLPELHP